MSNVDFVRQLDRQLRYIETSAREYDQGNKEEAIRIATNLRVIFHNTAASTSLLAHLQARLTKIMTTLGGPPYPRDSFLPMGSIRINMKNQHVHSKDCLCYEPLELSKQPTFEPWLDKKPLARQVQATDWWSSEPVIILHGRKSLRKDVVLWAANKDGGAHVDAALPEDYLHLSSCISVAVHVPGGEDEKVEGKPDDVHFALLRQMAHEVLRSPELHKLAGR